ncbi:MAG: efflux RND transporter periplasmic adaptor subunit, partial [Gammaproteobacteria bacterium]
GSVTARASFPNPAHRLMPGTLARVHLTIEVLEGVAAIDPRAVAQGLAGPMVFVIDEENVAHARDVELGPIVNGQQVVRDGLAAGDRVVVNGNVALRDGAPVNPVSGPRSR